MFAILLAAMLASAPRAVPDAKLTPGATSSIVNQENIQWTICKSGYSKLARPSVAYTTKIKRQVMNQYGYSWSDRKKFELDHLISIELGGDPADPRNLWPEPWDVVVAGHKVGAHTKDKLENELHKEVCSGKITLSDAQHEIAGCWIAAYQKHVGPLPETK